MNFQGLSVARNCLRHETAPSPVLAIKKRLLCNFAKTFKGAHFMRHSATDLKFSILLICKSSKLSSHSLLKIC